MLEQEETNTKNTASAADILRFSLYYWKRHAWRAILAVLCVFAALTIDIIVPILTGKIVDSLTKATPGDMQAAKIAWDCFLWFTGLSVLFHIFMSSAVFLWNWFASQNLYDIVTDGLRQVQRFSSDWHANSFSGATVRKLTRGMWSFDVFEDTIFFGFIPATFMMIGMTTMLALRLPEVAMFAAVIVVLYVGLTILMSVKILAPRFKIGAAADTKMGATLADIVTGIATVKTFASEDREDERLAEVATSWRRKSLRSWQASQMTEFVRSLLRMALFCGVVGIVIWMWEDGKASAGDIALVITAFFMMSGYLRDIGRYINDLQRSASEIEDVVLFWKHEPEIQDKADAKALVIAEKGQERGRISFEHVRFAYPDKGADKGVETGRKVYDDFSVTIKAGEKVALVGASGSGKSTFVKLIQRLYDVQSGAIRIDGQNIADVTQASLRKAIALVPQEPILFHRSLADNIGYGRPSASMDDIVSAAEQAYAHDFIQSLSHGYDTLVGERGVKLSGGERQRVAIARAILADCPILILDEATSSLDSVSEHYIQKALERLMEGRTTITIAHRLATIQNADRILVFDKGKIVEQGSHKTLLGTANSVYRRLYDMQALDLLGDTLQAAE